MKNCPNNPTGFSILLLLAVAFMVSCSPEDLGDIPPFSPTVQMSYVIDDTDLLTVSFTSTTTNAVSYGWDFGDGNASTDPNPVHTYASEGDYEVSLTVTGVEGATPAVATQTVTVE